MLNDECFNDELNFIGRHSKFKIMQYIGVVDSGVGGLSVLVELRRLLPSESFYYFADTASCPYGGRGRGQLIALSVSAVERLVELAGGVERLKAVVVACNTMTAAAIDTLRVRWPELPFVGMEPAVKPAAERSASGVVGILATEATLKGDLYRTTKERYAKGVEVIEVAGKGLVECVEQGRIDSEECRALLQKYIDPIVARGGDTLVLGCTHYPFLSGAIRSLYGDGLRLENPAPAVARHTRRLLEERGVLAPAGSSPELRFATSGGADDLAHLMALVEG